MKQDGFDLVTCLSTVARSTNWVSDVNESLPVTGRDSFAEWRQDNVKRQGNHRLSMANSHHHKRGANVNGDVTSERSQDDTWGASNDDMCDTQDQQQNLQQPSQRRKIERRTRWRTVGWIKRTSKGSAWQARDKMLIRGTEWIWKIDFCHDGDPLIKCHSSESTDAAAWTDTRSTRMGGTTPTVDRHNPAIQDGIIRRSEDQDLTTEEITTTRRCVKIVVDCCKMMISRE